MDKAAQLAAQKRWAEARDLLERLDRRYPRRPELLTELVNVYYELDDTGGYQLAVERLLKADPDNAEAMLGLAGSYLETNRPVLALRTFRAFVERWPDHKRASDARGTIILLETTLDRLVAELGVPDDEAGWELALLHEEMGVHLTQGRFSQVRKTAEQILSRYPESAPTLNNLSRAYHVEGQNERAIETAERVLTFEPENVHALANLVRFLLLGGRAQEARSCADKLRLSTAPAVDKTLKQMEAYTYLGDDPTVLELFEGAAGTGERDESLADPVLFHLAGVAALRLGLVDRARKAWKQALRVNRGFQLARENLDDLRRPQAERHAPWPFPISSWLSQKTLADLQSAFKSIGARGAEKKVGPAARRFLKKHPEVTSLMPFLLERGDPYAREMAVALIRFAGTPELLEALKTFALGPFGPDEMRMEAANFLNVQGLLPGGLTPLYIEGERKDIMLIGFEIGDESEEDEAFPPRVAQMAGRVTLALQAGDWERAESLLQEALALEPDSPGLLNNLAVAYEQAGRREEAHTMVRELHARFPDYLFARVTVARMAIKDGDVARAHALLDPLLERKKLHFSEFGQLCSVLIDLNLAEGHRDAARTWFDLWESNDPENPQLAPYRLRLGRIGRMLNRFRKK